MRTYRAVYRSPTGNEIVIKSLKRPPKVRSFRTAVGNRKHSLVKLQSTLREVIIVASTKNRKRAVEQDELEESEAIDDLESEIEELEDLEDEEIEEDEGEEESEEPEDEVEDEAEEDEEEEEEEEEEEAPRRAARTRKGTTTKAKSTTKSRASADGMVGTSDVAEHFGIDSRSLRMLLRKNEIPVDPDSNRYQWKSLTSPQVVRIGKLISAGEHKKAQREQLDKVRAKKAAAKPAPKPAAKKAPAKKATPATKTRRRRVEEEDED
jgi:hypothetical protein